MAWGIQKLGNSVIISLDSVDRLALNSDGSLELLTPAANPTGNDVPTAGQLPFVKEYNSPAQAMANSALFTLTHGLGVEPKDIQLIAQCKTADGGYSVGDRIRIAPSGSITGVSGICPSLRADVTAIYVKCGPNGFPYLNASGSGGVTLTHANWDLYVRAWA